MPDPLDALRLPVVPVEPRPEFADAVLRRMEGLGGPAARQAALQVEDLPAAVEELRGKGAQLRNDIVAGVGVRQILIEDPSGNPIELFEPLAAYHERAAG